MLAALLVVFPLGLCRSVDSLSGISLCSLLFYAFLALQLSYLSWPHFSWGWWNGVSWWNNSGLLKCIPIFALAFACQTYVVPLSPLPPLPYPFPLLSHPSFPFLSLLDLAPSLLSFLFPTSSPLPLSPPSPPCPPPPPPLSPFPADNSLSSMVL